MTDIKKIKADLESKLKELTARVEEIDDKLSETGDDDWQEQAVESQNDEVLEGVGGITQDEIRQVKYALSQIEAGRYGICATCGNAIGKERLEALPDATLCIKCS
jgi:RNA polymerase-binding transcription factor DksA